MNCTFDTEYKHARNNIESLGAQVPIYIGADLQDISALSLIKHAQHPAALIHW